MATNKLGIVACICIPDTYGKHKGHAWFRLLRQKCETTGKITIAKSVGGEGEP
jgi:hypothetical protein